jgi:hypothetical protein
MEYLHLENGVLVKSEIKPREITGDTGDLRKHISSVFGSEIEKVDLFCREGDEPHLTVGETAYRIEIHTIAKALHKIPSHTYSLFEELSTAKKIQKRFLAALVFLLLGGAAFSFYQVHKNVEDDRAQSRMFQEEQKRWREAEQRANNRLGELREQYAILIGAKTVGPYETADVISRCLDERATIISITIKDGFFQMEARALDSLVVLKTFENNRKVSNPMLQQVHPLGNSERFTLSGTVLPETESVDQLLPVSEQTAILEALIKKEEDFRAVLEKVTPSTFGVNVRGLLIKWGCSLDVYQYMNAENGQEIEFSIRSTSSRFFNFLKEASANNGGWIFTLVEIRNLAPLNVVDAIFRVKAETIIDSGFQEPEPYEEAPVSQISRNYYTAPVRPAVVRETPAVPPPPPPKVEQVSWLEYIGTTGDNSGGQFIYVKNTRTGALIRLEEGMEGDQTYQLLPSGSIEARLDGKLYEIRRR